MTTDEMLSGQSKYIGDYVTAVSRSTACYSVLTKVDPRLKLGLKGLLQLTAIQLFDR